MPRVVEGEGVQAEEMAVGGVVAVESAAGKEEEMAAVMAVAVASLARVVKRVMVEVEAVVTVEVVMVELGRVMAEGVQTANDRARAKLRASEWSAWCPGADRASSHSRSWEQ